MQLATFLHGLPDQTYEGVRAQLFAQLGVKARDQSESDLYQLMFTEEGVQSSPPDQQGIIADCVGTVVEKGSNRIVAYSFPLTTEVVVSGSTATPETAAAAEALSEAWGPARVSTYLYVEGTKLMLYYYAGTWRLSTNRMLDATRAFWQGDVSFGTEFLQLCASQYPALHDSITRGIDAEAPSLLRPGLTYSFILSASSNRMVTRSSVDPPGGLSLQHISTYDTDALAYVNADIGVPGPQTVEFADYTAMARALSASETDTLSVSASPGFVALIVPSGRYKILGKAYVDMRKLRGNTPSLQKRCLELRSDPETLACFLDSFPDARAVSAATEKNLGKLASWLHSVYVSYFVTRHQVFWAKPVFVTIRQVHEGYKATGVKRTRQHVLDHVLGLPADIQDALLNIHAASKANQWFGRGRSE